jgi:pimeloyl-ACP methyl ester carboxylesterase
VVALSFGTLLALQVAIEYPDDLEAVVLAAPAFGGGPQDEGVGRRYVETAIAYRMLGAGPELTALWMRSPPDVFKGVESRTHVRRRVARVVDAHRWTELDDGSLRTLATHPQTHDSLGRIRASTLVLVGEHDLEMAKESADLLTSWLPACRRVDLPGLGHLCLIEDPPLAARPLAAHLGAAVVDG